MALSQLGEQVLARPADRADCGRRAAPRRQHLAADEGDVGSSHRSFSATRALYQFITDEISRLRTR